MGVDGLALQSVIGGQLVFPGLPAHKTGCFTALPVRLALPVLKDNSVVFPVSLPFYGLCIV